MKLACKFLYERKFILLPEEFMVIFVLIRIQNYSFSENFFDYYYYSTHARLAPWLIGFLFGAFLAKNEGRPFKISRIANLTIWAVVLASFLTMIFTGTDIQNNYDRIQTTIYLTLSRPALAVMLCWVVFACSKGYGGDFLFKLKFLTYTSYLKTRELPKTNKIQSDGMNNEH